MFVLVKSIDLCSSQSDPSKKIRWVDLWSYDPPSFPVVPLRDFRKNQFDQNAISLVYSSAVWSFSIILQP